MTYGVYSVRDRLNGFMSITVDYSDESASRGFSSAFMSGALQQYAPGDFDLYRIGSFDTETGVISALAVPALVQQGYNIVRKDSKE